MLQSNIIILPGSTTYGSFIEINIPTSNPLEWVNGSRSVLSFLLEGFKESDLPDGAKIRAYGVRLLTWLYPLPSQFMDINDKTAVPAYGENGGFYLTGDGLRLRFGDTATFEELDTIYRALTALAFFNAYEMEQLNRARLFTLIHALRPTVSAMALLLFDQCAPPDYHLEKADRQIIGNMVTTYEARAALFLRALDTPAERLNNRWFKALAYLSELGTIEPEINNVFEILATGTMDDDTDEI
jgi:hypothetical protein